MRGKLGDVTILRNEPRHPRTSEPRAQAIDEAIELGIILAFRKPDLLVRTRLRDDDRQSREVEPEAGIDLVSERSEPLDEERADCRRLAQRARCAGKDALDGAVGPEQD